VNSRPPIGPPPPYDPECGAALSALPTFPPLTLDDRNESPPVHQMADQRMCSRPDNALGWTALLGESRGGQDVSQDAAPPRATDLTGLPPTVTDGRTADTFRDEDVDFATGICRAGGVVELDLWPGGFHGFDGIAPSAGLSKAGVAARASWLTRLLLPARATGPRSPGSSGTR
jgi:acetyl esterase/lipase